MKPSKRCNLCNKPIWDYDFVTIHDSYMDHDVHIHSCCYKQEKQQIMNAIMEDAMTMKEDRENEYFDRC